MYRVIFHKIVLDHFCLQEAQFVTIKCRGHIFWQYNIQGETVCVTYIYGAQCVAVIYLRETKKVCGSFVSGGQYVEVLFPRTAMYGNIIFRSSMWFYEGLVVVLRMRIYCKIWMANSAEARHRCHQGQIGHRPNRAFSKGAFHIFGAVGHPDWHCVSTVCSSICNMTSHLTFGLQDDGRLLPT